MKFKMHKYLILVSIKYIKLNLTELLLNNYIIFKIITYILYWDNYIKIIILYYL